jgi:hypothetical protein
VLIALSHPFALHQILSLEFTLFYYTTEFLAGYHLHEYLLACWGVPIGEMIDLEKLAEASTLFEDVVKMYFGEVPCSK